jgi:F-type H+-transporting ATPase subunit a
MALAIIKILWRPSARVALVRAVVIAMGLHAVVSARPAAAQEIPTCGSGETSPIALPASEEVDFITPHLLDSHQLDLPYLKSPFVCEVKLPRWSPVRVGPFTIDFSPTKHVIMLLVASLLCMITLLSAAAFQRRRVAKGRAAGGFSGGVEAMVLYLRQTVVLPNVGPHGDAYTPFILSVFFFILFANLLGLIPYGSTATGNVSVTATMALISFVVIEISGIRALGKGYWNTIFYWNHDLALPVRIPMFFLMTVIEIVSKLTKPFALTIRLFANMTAGHVVLLALISLIFTFHSYIVALVPVGMGVAVSLLEIFVAFLQAFIFALLTAVFIGQIRESAH